MSKAVLVVVAILLYIVWKVYQSFFGPIKKYSHLMERVAAYDKIGNRPKTVKLLEEALKHPKFPLAESEVGNILLELGERSFKMRQYEQAVQHFDALFQRFADENFYYTPQFVLAIQAYLRAEQPERAREVYHDLLGRQRYDKQFQKIRQAEAFFESPRA